MPYRYKLTGFKCDLESFIKKVNELNVPDSGITVEKPTAASAGVGPQASAQASVQASVIISGEDKSKLWQLIAGLIKSNPDVQVILLTDEETPTAKTPLPQNPSASALITPVTITVPERKARYTSEEVAKMYTKLNEVAANYTKQHADSNLKFTSPSLIDGSFTASASTADHLRAGLQEVSMQYKDQMLIARDVNDPTKILNGYVDGIPLGYDPANRSFFNVNDPKKAALFQYNQDGSVSDLRPSPSPSPAPAPTPTGMRP